MGRRGLAGGNGAEVGGQVRGKGKKMPGPFEWKRMLDEQEKVGKECVADSLFEGEGGVAAAARGGG